MSEKPLIVCRASSPMGGNPNGNGSAENMNNEGKKPGPASVSVT